MLKLAQDKLDLLHTKKRLMTNSPAFCYIILLRTPLPSSNDSDTKICGCWINDETKLLDLRVSIPSYYLRPHAQHGLMLTRVDDKIDYMDLVEGIIRINIADAISWLGNSQTLSMSSLFPSPCYDNGLRKLLNIRAFADYLEIPTV